MLILAAAFGGAGPRGDGSVWEWDGHVWQSASSAHPLDLMATQGVSAAYSPDLHATVLIDPGSAMTGGQTYLYDATGLGRPILDVLREAHTEGELAVYPRLITITSGASRARMASTFRRQI